MIALLLVLAQATAEPALQDVLGRAAAYVAEYERLITAIVADEWYVQEMGIDGRRGDFLATTRRESRSDLLLLRDQELGYLEFRNTYEVDGTTVATADERRTALQAHAAPGTEQDKRAVRDQSTAYNLGDIVRTINTPLMALQVLRRAERPGFTFARTTRTEPDLQHAAAADAGVFRVATEVWVVEFRERQRGTVVRTLQGRDVPSRGRLWIEPVSGRILMTEIVVENREVRAQMTVNFQSEPLLGVLVPVEMRESYRSKTRAATRIETRAVYGKFSEFSVK